MIKLDVRNHLKKVPRLQHTVRVIRRRFNTSAVFATERLISHLQSYEILVVLGLRRSGNHLAINWIINQADGSSVFYNDINFDMDPLSARRSEYKLRMRNRSPRIILSYEDMHIHQLLSPLLLDFLTDRTNRHGAKVRFAVILRDPYNLFASRIRKWPERFATPQDCQKQISQYLEHINLGLNPCPIWQDSPIIPLLYNDLVTAPETRADMAINLGINMGHLGLDDVPVYGHGSSFDGVNLSGGSLQERVLSRWETMENDPIFRHILGNPDIQRVGRDVFGMEPPKSLRIAPNKEG